MEQFDQKIISILKSIDTIEKAEAPPFFKTRVNANLDRVLEKSEKVWMPFKQPVWIIATLVLFLFANALLIRYSVIDQRQGVSSNVEANSLQGFANDYELNSANTY